LNDQELLAALDDGNGCAQGSKRRKPTVKNEAGARHDPEQAATQVFKSLQPESLACENFRAA